MSSVPAIDTKALEERLKPRIFVGNAGDYTMNPQVGGRFYPVLAGGEVQIGDIQDYPWTKDATGKRVRNWGEKVTTMSALDVAKAVCSVESFGALGLYIKVGDMEIDEQSRFAARERWIAWQTDYCLSVEAGWIARVTAHTAANPGAAPPRQPKRVQKTLAWLEQNAGDTDADRKEFICRTCSSEFDLREALNGHIRERHPALAKEIVDAFTSAAPTGPEAGDDTYDPSVFLAKARELKVKLLKEELEGLIEGDPKVVDAVTTKLAAAAKAAAEKGGDRG